MSYIDLKYINMLIPRFERFAWKTSTLAVCRCPLCGDSKKNKAKKRFYFYLKGGEYHVKCHNCEHAGLFSTFLKNYDPEMYKEYRMERFQFTHAPVRQRVSTTSPKAHFDSKIKIDLPKISELPDNHKAVQYLTSREVPDILYEDIFYCADFPAFARGINPTRNYFDDPKIVIPFRQRDGTIYGVICRTLNPYSELRYIILKQEGDDREVVYGLDRIDTTKTVYILEGPIDSMMIPNSVALSTLKVMAESSLPAPVENCVFVYDNEPRNRDVVGRMYGAVEKGYSICIWPEYIKKKDVNDMVLAGLDPKSIIDSNTYSGLMAKIKIIEWSKA